MSDLQPLYVRIADCQKVFGISPDTIYRASHHGEITIYKRGGASLLKVSE